jgi:membrane dipeptidase
MRKLAALAFAILVTTSLFAAPAKKKAAATAAPPLPVIVDSHADTPSEFLKQPFDLGVWNAFGSVDYPRMKAGGVDAEFFAAYVPKRYANKGAAAYCMRIMETIHEMVDDYPKWAGFAASTTDIRTITGNGKRAILIGIEGGHAIEDSLDLLRAFYRFGARYMTLTHTNTNNWADSSGDEAKHNGLTAFGKDVVVEMNRLGMLVDISHVSDKTFYDVIETSKAPVIASHSSARALCDHPRNMTDDMLRAVQKNHGVVMVNFYPVFLSQKVRDAAKRRDEMLKPQIAELKAKDPSEGDVFEAGMDELYKTNPLPKIPYTVIVDHIDHIAKVAGVDSVGLGSDFDGISDTPSGMEHIGKIPSIRAELRHRGYSDADIRKIMGENFMRVFGEVERVSREMNK